MPVPLPSVAQVLQREQEATTDWFGAGTLRDLLELLDLAPLVFTSVDEGYVFDPTRHERPARDELRDAFRLSDPELYAFAVKAHRLTAMPVLSPAQYDILFTVLLDAVKENGFSRTDVIRAIEDQCENEGLPLDVDHIIFVVEAIVRGGVNMSGIGNRGPVDAQRLRKAFSKNIDDLCAASRMALSREERTLLNRWIHPSNLR